MELVAQPVPQALTALLVQLALRVLSELRAQLALPAQLAQALHLLAFRVLSRSITALAPSMQLPTSSGTQPTPSWMFLVTSPLMTAAASPPRFKP